MRARDYVDPATGQWKKEYAIAPRFTPEWLKVRLEEGATHYTEGGSPINAPIVEISFPSLDEAKTATGRWVDPAEHEQQWRNNLLSLESVKKGYRAKRENGGWREREWIPILDAVGIHHEGSTVWWYDPDGGAARMATLWDLAHLKQGVPQDEILMREIGLLRQDDPEDPRIWQYESFLGRPLWLLSEKQFDNAEFPPPIKGGPPYSSSATAAAETGRMRDMQANDYDSIDDALAQAPEFLGAEYYDVRGGTVRAYAPEAHSENWQPGDPESYVVYKLFKAKGLWHWPDEVDGYMKDPLPRGVKRLERRRPLAAREEGDWAVEWINPTTKKRQIYFDDLSQRQAEIEARTLRMHHPNADVRVVRRGFETRETQRGGEPSHGAPPEAWEGKDRSAEALFWRIKKQGGRVFAKQQPNGRWRVWVRFHEDQGEAMGEAATRDAALFAAWKNYGRGADLEETPQGGGPLLAEEIIEVLDDWGLEPNTKTMRGRRFSDCKYVLTSDIIEVNGRPYKKQKLKKGDVIRTKNSVYRLGVFTFDFSEGARDNPRVGEPLREETRDNPVDVSDALPWVKVSRDPERYQEALKEAKAIGPIDDPKKVFELLGPALLKEDQEVWVVVLLDVRQQCRGVAEVHRGSRSRVSTSVVDTLRIVIASGAEGFVVAHNHPSGKATPSEADRDLTKAIEKAAKLFDGDISFVDHVVIGSGEFYSFADHKLYKSKKQ